jgi:Na+/proline symporter
LKLQAPWFKPAAWGAVLGCIATMFVGFAWLGWTLGSTAERMAAERTNAAVVVALTPSCVATFMQQPGAAAKLAEFQKIESWKQREFIEAGGWATLRGDKTPNVGVATACAEELAKIKT